MNLIMTKSRKKYWTNAYEIQKGYFVIKRLLKNAPDKTQTIMIPESEVTEIVINQSIDSLVSKKVK